MDPSVFSQFSNDFVSILFSATLILIAVNFVQTVILSSAVTHIASESYFGERVSIVAAFQAISPRLPTVGVATLITYGVLLLVGIALAAILFACGLGFGVIVYASLTLQALLTPVAVLERQGVMGTVGRAFVLGKLHVWAIFRATILFLAFTQIVNLVLSPLTSSTSGAGLGLLVAVVLLIAGAALAPLYPIAMTLLYYDARNRYEGLDTALMAIGKVTARPMDVPSPAPGRLLNNRDLSNLVVMSIVTLGLLFAALFVQMMFAPLTG